MKKLIFIFLFLVTSTLIALTISERLIYTATTSMTTGETEAVSVTEGGTGITLAGDSVGFNVNFSVDSIQGYLTYNWVTADGNLSPTTSTLTLSDGSTSFSLAASQNCIFTQSVPKVAGVYRIYLYLNLTNNNYNTVTLVTKTRKVTWN